MPVLTADEFAALTPAAQAAARVANLEYELYLMTLPAGLRKTDYSLAGRSFSWTEYKRLLLEMLAKERANLDTLTAPASVTVALD